MVMTAFSHMKHLSVIHREVNMTENNWYCFRLLALIGVHPLHALHKSIVVFNSFVLICMHFLVLIKLCAETNLESVESLSELSQVSIKYAVLIFKRDAMKQALGDVAKFWKHKLNDPQINALIKNLETGGKLYAILMSFIFAGFVVKPFILTGSSIFGCYIPPQIPYPLFYFIEFYVLWILVMTYTGFNMLICSIIILTVAQFRLLNVKIKSLNLLSAMQSSRNLKICLSSLKVRVTYHNFLITFTENLSNILSRPLFLSIIISVSLLCINAYILSSTNVSKIDFFRNGLVSFVVVCEFFFIYGLPAQLLTDEAGEIGNTAYFECDWYLPKIIPVRKYLLMMMIRSQRPVRISAENFIDIDNRTILMMLRTTYSFYTFFKTIT